MNRDDLLKILGDGRPLTPEQFAKLAAVSGEYWLRVFAKVAKRMLRQGGRAEIDRLMAYCRAHGGQDEVHELDWLMVEVFLGVRPVDSAADRAYSIVSRGEQGESGVQL